MLGWKEILAGEVSQTSKEAAAEKIGYSRTAVHLALNGGYKGSTDNLAAAVMKHLGEGILCPHLGIGITLETCRDHHTRMMPQSNARALRHWRACQTCKHNAENMTEKADD